MYYYDDGEEPPKECPDCGGWGYFEGDDAYEEICETCGGTGQVNK